jgi:hypothetical protein
MSDFSIITTYRNREAHKRQFLAHFTKIHPEAEIIIVEQADDRPFNRGLLMNIGVLHSDSAYFDLCDIDMIPKNKISYKFPAYPTLLATKVQQFRYEKPYPKYFSGHVLMNYGHYLECNGYPNTFWGWGGEDDELRRRIEAKGMTIIESENRFRSLPHPRKINEAQRQENVKKLQAEINWTDGFSSCMKHATVITASKQNNIKHIKVRTNE